MSVPGRAAELAAAVLAHPGVESLDGGPFGTVASYLVGERVVGVRIGTGGEPVELAVVARLGAPATPLPRLAEELGAVVRGLLGPVAVEITFSDVVTASSTGS
ncbi:hypothetical protein GCM10010464_65110 [Pseudonocardia yunnanensis]|uniref:Asp23/Gls24 family envelope stress response protein n=1 Tax=Pseudonocardia yunnanensis TaxID=58107 RepID=A0ABW4F8N7_9PSEU